MGVLEAARKENMPFVLDADGLNLAQTRPELVHGYRECILTPNVVEFGRLCKSKGIDTSGLKRSGGQGDTLTGSLATFLGWRKAYLDKLWDHDGDLDAAELLALAAFGGSSITRESSRLAFAKKGRSLQASDLTDEVYVAFTNLFEGSGPKL